MVDFYGINVGKYTSPMDGMGAWDGSYGVELNLFSDSWLPVHGVFSATQPQRR